MSNTMSKIEINVNLKPMDSAFDDCEWLEMAPVDLSDEPEIAEESQEAA